MIKFTEQYLKERLGPMPEAPAAAASIAGRIKLFSDEMTLEGLYLRYEYSAAFRAAFDDGRIAVYGGLFDKLLETLTLVGDNICEVAYHVGTVQTTQGLWLSEWVRVEYVGVK